MSAELNTAWAMLDQIPVAQAPEPKLPEIYYDTGKKDYWIQNRSGDWIPVSETSIRRHLMGAGLCSKRMEGEAQSKVDEHLTQMQLEKCVPYAGPLAGYSQGITIVSGKKILVTSSPKLIDSQMGEGEIIHQLILSALGQEQQKYLYGWLKIAYEALRAGRRRPGQVLVLAGKRNAGKSLIQNIITEIFGGRVAKPYRYMCGATDFNGDLMGAEHLTIEDEIASTDIRMRRAFGSRIKEFTVNTVQSCHHKNREALSLAPFWRVSVSVNDEPENLQILPPFDESVADKIMLFKTSKAEMPMRTFTDEERVAFWAAITSNLPAFLHMLTEWEIPKELECGRYGIQTYHNPDLVEALSDTAPELKLLSYLDNLFAAEGAVKDAGKLSGTAEQLEHDFVDLYAHEARRLFSWSGAMGTYLGRLANKFPDRVKMHRKSHIRLWEIFAPPPEAPAAAK